jgi:CDP-paratose 2-epimerase
MRTVVITGAAGLVGSESVKFFCEKDFHVVGIDNDMRRYFFGEDASTRWMAEQLQNTFKNFINFAVDIRNAESIFEIFAEYGTDICLIIHAAAQPSHEWAAKEPVTDFTINANGTLNLLEATKRFCPDAVFIFTSTNKVYGDRPNSLPLVEHETRWEIAENHPYHTNGIDESMSIDNSLHSLFGASKVAADLMTQEYGKYFGLKTGIFRGGCLTGPTHFGAELHGFLSYLMKCAVTGAEYRIFGYHGKQVRDNIHSYDLVNAFYHFFLNPKCGEVYNIGGSRLSNCSMLEAIEMCEVITGKPLKTRYLELNRVGDHIWWISDVSKFKRHYPTWDLTKAIPDILGEIYEFNLNRWNEAQSIRKCAHAGC